MGDRDQVCKPVELRGECCWLAGHEAECELFAPIEHEHPTTGWLGQYPPFQCIRQLSNEIRRVVALAAHCRDQNRLLLMNAGTYGNILRWMPPLVVTEDEIALGLKAFGEALDATA